MFRTLYCLTGEHDLRLVALAGLVCFLASLVAISVFHRACASRGKTRVSWLLLAGAATGCGIWATHFIAMLAYDPGVGIAYDIPLLALSLTAAAVVTCIGLSVAVRSSSPGIAQLGGGIVGGGVAAMHYTGMWAVQVPGQITWAPDLVVASLILGVLFGVLALAVAVRRSDPLGTLIAALMLTLAIVSHHFTAMGAVEIVADPTRSISPFSLTPTSLAVAVASVTIAILAISLVGAAADHRLGQQFARLQAAINNMPQGLCMFDGSARLIVCNDRYLDMYGMPRHLGEAGRSIFELMSHRLSKGTLAVDPNEHAAELVKAAREGRTTNRLVEAPDGRAISISTRPIADGGWVATHEDLTEQRREEKERERAQMILNTFSLLEATLENVNQGIMMTDADGRVPLCNRRAVELLGLPSELTASRPKFDDVVDHLRQGGEFKDAETASEAWTRPCESGGSYQSFQHRRPNGVILEIRSVPLPNGGSVRTFTDVSELLKTERFSVLGQLTATVAHELRNPLSAIKNTTVALRQMSASQQIDLERPISRIERSIGRCDRLVADLLEYTKKRDLNLQPMAIDQWLGEVLDEQRLPDGVSLVRELSAGNAQVGIDADRFRRVIINLIENAAQAMQEQDRERTIRISSAAAGGAEVIISDTGPGIAPEVLPRVFEPLFSTKSFGTGLGLPTVKQIVEQHGGTVEVTSQVGVGTTVRIKLPGAVEERAAA